MYSSKLNAFGIYRWLIWTTLAAIIVFVLLQFNLPTQKEIGDRIILEWTERQIELREQGDSNLLQNGWIYYNLGHLDKAKSNMEKAYAKDHSLSALYCLGLIDLKYRRFDEGIAKLESVIKVSPDHVPTMMSLGKLYFEQRYYGRSKDLFIKAVESEPTNADARVWLGKTYLYLNETEKARNVLSTLNVGPEAQEAAALLRNI